MNGGTAAPDDARDHAAPARGARDGGPASRAGHRARPRSYLLQRARYHLATVVEAVRAFGGHHPMQLAAALSYYTVLSLAPLVLVTVSMAGLIFGREAVEGHLVEELGGLVGAAGAELVQTVLRHASTQGSSALSLAVGVLSLLIGATTVFVQLQYAVNQIWHVQARTDEGAIRRLMKKRLLSLTMVLAVGFLLLVSLVLSAALTALGKWAGGTSLGAAFPFLLHALDSLVSFGVVLLLFAMLFRYLPDVELGWRDVWFGALVTAALFTLGKLAIGIYLGRAGIGSAYGAAGSVVVFLVWVYYAALILFFGFELTQVRTERRRGRAAPEEHAVQAAPGAAEA